VSLSYHENNGKKLTGSAGQLGGEQGAIGT
jgi:hypothetical protein